MLHDFIVIILVNIFLYKILVNWEFGDTFSIISVIALSIPMFGLLIIYKDL